MKTSSCNRVVAAFAAVLVAGSIPVIAQSPQALIGGANPSPGGFLQRQVYCNPASSVCGPILGAPSVPWAGGTAYEASREVVWDTDGLRLTGVRILSNPPCRPICQPAPVPGLPTGAVATGLAFDDVNNLLYVIDSSPEIISLSVQASAPCPIVRTACKLSGVIPTTHQPGGLAYSEKWKAIFYSASNFTSGTPNNVVFIAPAGNVCTPGCKFVPPSCLGFVLGPITGLAYDDGADTLYLTDGKAVQRLLITPSGNCVPTLIDCCTAPVLAPYYGLEIEPSHAQGFGTACTSAPCPSCPSMFLGQVGDAVIGNASFALQVTSAPSSGFVLGYLGVGGCTPGIPVVCGFFYPSLSPIPLGFVALSGSPTCGGSATFPLPIPTSYILVGLPICAQGVVVCTPSGGLGLTNGLNIMLSDN